MKTKNMLRLIAALALGVAATPLFATTLSVPNDSPAFTVDIPADWKPKTDKEDKSVEATEPGDHVYMCGWVVPDKTDVSELTSDLNALLKDSMKSIDEKKKEETIENNGIKFHVVEGSGLDKREGSKVQFFVAFFKAGTGKIGVYYVDYDADAPADMMKRIIDIMNSIKLKG
jgi:hypothetical protein